METKTKKSFTELINGNKPVLVDFFAEWCAPCKMMPPILKELKQMSGDSITILKIDIDRNSTLASSLDIQGVPTLILFMSGQIKWRQSGVVRAQQLYQIIKQFS